MIAAWIILAVALLAEFFLFEPAIDGFAFIVVLALFCWVSVLFISGCLRGFRFVGWWKALFLLVSGVFVGLNFFWELRPINVDVVCDMVENCTVDACNLDGVDGLRAVMVNPNERRIKDGGHSKFFDVTRGWISTRFGLFELSNGEYRVAFGKFGRIQGVRDGSVIRCSAPSRKF